MPSAPPSAAVPLARARRPFLLRAARFRAGSLRTGRFRTGLACLATCLAAGLAALASLAGCGKETAPPPEHLFVLVVVDTLRWDALSCYGAERETPHLDALAADSIRFEQAISASGWTLPSVASMLTSVWPSEHKALGKRTRLTPITDDVPTAAELFAAAGFHTIGYTNASFLSDMLGVHRGFAIFDHQYATNFKIRRADETVQEALGDLEAHGGRNVFALVHLFDPHLNYDPPASWVGRYHAERQPALPLSFPKCLALRRDGGTKVPSQEDVDYVRAVYDEEVGFVDEQLGLLVRELRNLGLYDAATIVVTADHGEELWEHGGFEHGHTVYDELVRLPLLVKPPAGAELEPGVVAAQVRTVDLLPTFLELAGIEAPDHFAGHSLLPLLRGEREPAPRVAFSEATLYGDDLLAWRSDPYKYIRPRSPGPGDAGELYDWRADPWETTNLVTELPDVAERLRGELDAFYRDLTERAKGYRVGVLQDMTPQRVAEELKRLADLGYTDGETGHQRRLVDPEMLPDPRGSAPPEPEPPDEPQR